MDVIARRMLIIPILLLTAAASLDTTAQTPTGDSASRLRVASERFDSARAAARDAIGRALAAAGSATETTTIRADILLERADLESSAGELDQALATSSQAVSIARQGRLRRLTEAQIFEEKDR